MGQRTLLLVGRQRDPARSRAVMQGTPSSGVDSPLTHAHTRTHAHAYARTHKPNITSRRITSRTELAMGHGVLTQDDHRDVRQTLPRSEQVRHQCKHYPASWQGCRGREKRCGCCVAPHARSVRPHQAFPGPPSHDKIGVPGTAGPGTGDRRHAHQHLSPFPPTTTHTPTFGQHPPGNGQHALQGVGRQVRLEQQTGHRRVSIHLRDSATCNVAHACHLMPHEIGRGERGKEGCHTPGRCLLHCQAPAEKEKMIVALQPGPRTPSYACFAFGFRRLQPPQVWRQGPLASFRGAVNTGPCRTPERPSKLRKRAGSCQSRRALDLEMQINKIKCA